MCHFERREKSRFYCNFNEISSPFEMTRRSKKLKMESLTKF